MSNEALVKLSDVNALLDCVPKNVCEMFEDRLTIYRVDDRPIENARMMLDQVRKHLEAIASHLEAIASRRDLVENNNAKTFIVPVDVVKQVVSDGTGVSVEDIDGDVRHASIRFARHIAFYISSRLANKSFNELGVDFKKHHTTVSAGVRLLQAQIKRDPKIKMLVEELTSAVQEACQ